MRKMITSIAAVLAVSALMVGAASAADKLVVKDSTGNNTVFKVDDAGAGIQVNDTTGTAKAIITGQGYIGSGTTAPYSVFHAQGPSTQSTQLTMQYYATNSNGGGGYLVYHNNAGGALPASGDRLGYFLFGSYWNDGSGGLYGRNGGGIVARAEGAWSSTTSTYSIPTYFAFETASPGVSSRSERLRISANGNIVTGNLGGAATADMATTSTNGFLYIPSVAGALTTCGTVTQYSGHVPVWFDTTNAKICTCQGTTLKCTAALN